MINQPETVGQCPKRETRNRAKNYVINFNMSSRPKLRLSLFLNWHQIHGYSNFVALFTCSVAVVSSVVVMSSHLITNRMRFYFFQSKCVVNVSSACHFPTRGGMQCKIVRLSLSFPRSKVENFMGYSCFMGLSLMPFGTLRIVERLIFLLRF